VFLIGLTEYILKKQRQVGLDSYLYWWWSGGGLLSPLDADPPFNPRLSELDGIWFEEGEQLV